MRPYDYCPRCQGIRTMSVSIAFKNSSSESQEEQEMLILNHQCETCLLFIRSTTLTGEDVWHRSEVETTADANY